MKLLIVRHGETEYNVKKIFQGTLNEKLNQKGVEQANKLSLRLKDEKIDVIFSSTLDRAKKTAEIINKYHNLEIQFKEELKEKNFGDLQGKSWDELCDIVKKSGVEFHKYKPLNGESGVEAQKRIVDFLYKIIEQHSEKTVLFVTHGAVIMELLFHLTELPRSEFKKIEQHNTALNIIEIDTNKHKIHLINGTKHLD
ncbi:MAG: histidine phosphatase family protein [Candidatus Aenigmatarchaeota archaeon]|nr:MAG: histidine phosphatase family protein [Candidatus Aenigmarchaeota archaeon]